MSISTVQHLSLYANRWLFLCSGVLYRSKAISGIVLSSEREHPRTQVAAG